MMVDEYEQYNNDRSDVAIINPDEPLDDAEPQVLADDCECSHILLPGGTTP